ncbi:MAG: 16S rRNA (guanine(966)-N(2))-methyltransferase RsmD [Geminicoccaceae bacterium]
MLHSRSLRMRIIAGRFRGRRLLSPEGREPRPTGDRAREALFDILEHGPAPVRGARFLDLFCGTGAIGLEAHSRGAAEVLLIDHEPGALRLAEANHARLGAPASVRVLRRDAANLGSALEAYDVAFLDPPYGSGLAAPALAALLEGWLAADARVIVELAAKEDLALPASFVLEQERRYGAAKFLILRLIQGATAAPSGASRRLYRSRRPRPAST